MSFPGFSTSSKLIIKGTQNKPVFDNDEFAIVLLNHLILMLNVKLKLLL